MRRGRNDVVVLDLTGPRSNRIGGLRLPILDQLRPENDLAGPVRRTQAYLTGVAPTHEGQFAPGAATQDVLFAQPAAGRQFCLEALGAFDRKPFAAVAEIALLDNKGQPVQVEVAGARYTPRQGASGVTGRIWQYRMYEGNRLASEP